LSELEPTTEKVSGNTRERREGGAPAVSTPVEAAQVGKFNMSKTLSARVPRGLSLIVPPILFCCLGSLIFALAGCSKAAPPASAQTRVGPDGVEVAAAEQAFRASDASLRFVLDDQLRLIGAGAYADAVRGLRKLADNPKVSPDQKKALEDLIQKLQALGPAKSV
jgi:hypothetical protein